MPDPATVNDRDPAAVDPDATLDSILGRVRLDGAVFFRGEYTERWAYESLTAEEYTALLRPGSGRLTIFHVVASGRCWVSQADGVRHWADAGDVIVLPYGDQHHVGGQLEAEMVSIAALIDPEPWTSLPVVRYGEGGARTDIVCGYLYSEDPLFDPRMGALPPLFVVSPPDGAARQWVRASIDYALQQTEPAPAGGLQGPPPRLPELLVREVLRIHLASVPSYESAWLSALRDPVLAPALAAIHGSPERKWTVDLLAQEASVSVSLLDERFRTGLRLPPIRYLTGWRMHVARDLLHSTDLGVAAIARRVGYDSEEAFSRAFKRANGVAPSAARS
jgi:AraC-like DNA-binding protein